MTAPTLTEFLLARIAEDEDRAGRWMEQWRSDGGVIDLTLTPGPARVLAECEAKRCILLSHGNGMPHECMGAHPVTYYNTERACPTIQYLALPYTDHPDYRQEWKP